MITLQLRFNNGKEEFLSVTSVEFDTATGQLLIGADGVRYGLGADCTVYVWIGSQVVSEYHVVGSDPNVPIKQP